MRAARRGAHRAAHPRRRPALADRDDGHQRAAGHRRHPAGRSRRSTSSGGVLGRPVEAVVADGESDGTTFAREAERLIREDGSCAIFGCWTSASRKAVVPVVEQARPPAVLPGAVRGAGAVAEHRLPGAGAQPADPAGRALAGRVRGQEALVPGRLRLRLPADGQRHHPRRGEGPRVRGRRRGVPAAGQHRRGRGREADRRDQAGRDPQHHQRRHQRRLLPGPAASRGHAEGHARPCRSASPSRSWPPSGRRDIAGDYAAWNYFQSLDTPAEPGVRPAVRPTVRRGAGGVEPRWRRHTPGSTCGRGGAGGRPG